MAEPVAKTPLQILESDPTIENNAGRNAVKSSVPQGPIDPATGKPTWEYVNPAAVALGKQNSTGLNTTGFGTGSVISTSNPIVTDENNIKNDVQNLINNDTSGITTSHNEYLDMLQRQSDALELRRTNELAGINSQFDQANTRLQQNQKGEKGTFGATLQRIGGYLGDSASSAGAMINLNQQHVFQVNDLEAKRQSALQEAKNAIDDKQFELAKAKAAEAKDYAKEIQASKQQFFDNSLKVLQAQQNQEEAYRATIKDKLTNLSFLEPDKIPNETKKEIDQFYGTPGFTDNYITVTNAANQAKSQKEVMDARKATLEFLQNIPAGQKITMPDGTEFTGMGKAGDVATFLQTDSDGVGHLITYNKLTGAKTITNMGVVGKSSGSNAPVGPVEKDNAVNIFQSTLEANKNEKTGQYDPDIYMELRKQLKDSKHPQLLPEMDKLFLNKSNGFFSDSAINRLRKAGIYYNESALNIAADSPFSNNNPYNNDGDEVKIEEGQ